ncbi:transglycosylase-like protein with SLT domain [Nocardia tenerifensis]|uniref:Transglycosylase-like protein with SLT domain n=1 Tax=Nocardia tenerifensis TaxID=228006 RepID=A0A318KA24_9NOCA|nr:transglycosylase SLT domain-containing protein [Nocardia tenerifensis]PXX68356.1 transglycosylase-like protein with SLT domain [Nocardia tenerifensis]
MTLNIPDVENWKPEQLTTVGEQAGTISQGLDTAVGKGSSQTKSLEDGKKWSGTAGAAANARMDTEKTRASAVSAALLELKTALTSQTQNLVEAKSKVLQLRDDAVNQSPPFDVEPNGTVNATTRIAALREHADKANVEGLVFQESLQAASRTWELTNALKTAETVADQAKTQVDAAVAKLEQAFGGLGEPSANVAPPASTTAASVASPTPVSNNSPSSSKPNYAMGNHNSGSSSGSPYSGSYSGSGTPSSSAPTGPMPSGDMAKWIAEAKQKLIEMGYDPKDIDERAIAMIIEHESAGNPYAENQWDSNWLAGHPSKGLMQTIDSTFNAYKAPGHDDIWNPVDNIIAGVRYSIDTYGSVKNVPGVVAVNSGGAYRGY